MESQRCGICFETFDATTETEYAHFEYIATAGHEMAYPNPLSFCTDCLTALREVTDHWTTDGSNESDCVFCGDKDHDGTRISSTFTTQSGEDPTTMVVYDLCPTCDEIFEDFLADERTDVLNVPDGWCVFGPTPRHLIGIGTDDDRIYVDPAVKRTGAGVQSMSAGVPETQANYYSVTLIKSLGTPAERPSEIATFEKADDAIKFAQLVALYAAHSSSPTEFIDSDFDPDPMEEDPWQPDPIITDKNRVMSLRKCWDTDRITYTPPLGDQPAEARSLSRLFNLPVVLESLSKMLGKSVSKRSPNSFSRLLVGLSVLSDSLDGSTVLCRWVTIKSAHVTPASSKA